LMSTSPEGRDCHGVESDKRIALNNLLALKGPKDASDGLKNNAD
nr:hypothetical protein [Tanacetum cinerariifolium]